MVSFLVLAQDESMGGQLRLSLEEAGYCVIVVQDLTAFDSPQPGVYDLVIFSSALPFLSPSALNSPGVVRHLRRDSPVAQVPVIVLTGSDNSEEMVRCLEDGADDCLSRPFHTQELLARVRAVLRRTQRAETVAQAGAGLPLHRTPSGSPSTSPRQRPDRRCTGADAATTLAGRTRPGTREAEQIGEQGVTA